MSTFLNDYIHSIDEKWQEIDILIKNAKKIEDSDEELYNALCRSITVLLVAHLEGFTKDLVKNVVRDLNQYCTFPALPTAIQRTYCKKYLGSNDDRKNNAYEKSMSKLIDKFGEINCSIEDEPFFFSKNRNPNSSVLKTVFNNFGITNIFDYLYGSSIEAMFSWSYIEIKESAVDLRKVILDGTEQFPYTIIRNGYGFEKSKSKAKTLWEEFLEQINQKRHSIAHGNVFQNAQTVLELEATKSKILLLQFALIAILISKLSQIEI